MNNVESLMRQFAAEIESDLAYRGIDVADWHRGTMSDRQLENLVRGLPENSAFRRALRDDDWSPDRYLLAAVLNEIRALRGDLLMMFAQETFDYEPILSPRQVADRDDARQDARGAHDELMATLRGQKAG
jgi:hypothetical protein